MFLGRVKGHVVATAKDETIVGQKMLIVEPLKVDYASPETAGSDNQGQASFGVTGRAIVVLDTLGAGEGQLVLVVQGSSARLAKGLGKMPVDAAIMGIVDEATVHGQSIQ